MSLGFGGQSSSTEGQDLTSNIYNQGGTSSTSRVLTPAQLQAQSQLTQVIHALSTNPQQFLAPAQNTARNQVNDNYSGVGDALRQQFMANTGGGSTGKFGTAELQSDLARRKSLSDVDTTFAQAAASAPITAANLSTQLLGMNMGTTGATSNTGTSSGVDTKTGSTTGVQGSFGI